MTYSSWTTSIWYVYHDTSGRLCVDCKYYFSAEELVINPFACLSKITEPYTDKQRDELLGYFNEFIQDERNNRELVLLKHKISQDFDRFINEKE